MQTWLFFLQIFYITYFFTVCNWYAGRGRQCMIHRKTVSVSSLYEYPVLVWLYSEQKQQLYFVPVTEINSWKAVKWGIWEMLAFHEGTFAPFGPRQLQVTLLLHYYLPVAPWPSSIHLHLGEDHSITLQGPNLSRGWHTHHTTDIMSVRPSHWPQVWGRAKAAQVHFYCNYIQTQYCKAALKLLQVCYHFHFIFVQWITHVLLYIFNNCLYHNYLNNAE